MAAPAIASWVVGMKCPSSPGGTPRPGPDRISIPAGPRSSSRCRSGSGVSAPTRFRSVSVISGCRYPFHRCPTSGCTSACHGWNARPTRSGVTTTRSTSSRSGRSTGRTSSAGTRTATAAPPGDATRWTDNSTSALLPGSRPDRAIRDASSGDAA